MWVVSRARGRATAGTHPPRRSSFGSRAGRPALLQRPVKWHLQKKTVLKEQDLPTLIIHYGRNSELAD